MNVAKPVNIWTMDVDKYVKENFVKEVTSPMIYEPSTQSFHPQGLYSESIFGQIGTNERMATLAYIDLHCTVLAPLIYLNIINVCSWYKDLIEGRVWAIWNKKDHEFQPVKKEEDNARTGFSFFLEHVQDCEYEKNNSKTRTQKIDTIYKAFGDGSAWVRKCLVCPAGWRDVKVDIGGKMEVDEVNKLYNSIMIASKEIRDVITTPEIAVFFDTAKVHLQLKLVEIFQYWKNFFEGKTGFGQARYAKRHLALGTRNVIISSPMIAKNPTDPAFIKHNETYVPLFQALKMFEPKVIYQLNTKFYSPIFTMGSVNVQVIDPKTKETTYKEIDTSTVTLALGNDYKHELINNFEDDSTRHTPISIQDSKGDTYWLWLVYDLDTEIYIGRSIQDIQTQVQEVQKNNATKETSQETTERIEVSYPHRLLYREENVKFLDTLNALKLDDDQYVIGASASAVLHGMPIENQDLDIAVPLNVFEELRMSGVCIPGKQDGVHDNNLEDRTGVINISTNNERFRFEDLFAQSFVVNGHRYLTLEGLYRFYKVIYSFFQKEKYLERLQWCEKELELRKKQEDEHWKEIDSLVKEAGIQLFAYDRGFVHIWRASNQQDTPEFRQLASVARSHEVNVCPSIDVSLVDVRDLAIEEKRRILEKIEDLLGNDDIFLATIGASITRNKHNLTIKALHDKLAEHEVSISSRLDEDWRIDSKVVIDTKKIRPLTIIEMFYIALESIPDKLCTVTRYPAIEIGSIYPSYAKILSTVPDRKVILHKPADADQDIEFAHYPVLGCEQYVEALTIHPSKTPGLNAE